MLSLLELGGQTALVRIYPTGAPSAFGGVSGAGASSAETWYAELYMQAGQLQYASVFSASGERRLVGEQALSFLGQMGGLSYELLPLPSRPALPPPTASTGPLPPLPPGYADPYAQSPESPFLPPAPNVSSWGPPKPALPPATWRPARTRWGERVVQNSQQLTRDQRRVLSLVNGQRTTDELSRLLGFSPESLSELLLYFRDQNLIS
ncbi:MAG TPA: hypothetical protein VKT82_12510 [Ktedonobacterales bacterium]|nr:hypothetical protein [Ktedonobacterales bacterium]